MAWTFEDKFNSDTKSTGVLNGQDGWTGDVDYIVTATSPYEGNQCIAQTSANGTISQTLGADVASGILYFALKADATMISSDDSTLRLVDASSGVRVIVGFHTGTVKYGAASVLTTYFTPTANTWYLIEVELISGGNYKLRYHNGTSWSSQTSAIAPYTGSGGDVRTITINSGGAGGTSYFDYISPTNLFGSPSVTTSAVTSIALNTATANGEVVSDEGSVITERGFVWSTSTLPTIANNKVTVTGTTGVYSGSMTGLAINTLYYVRAYATNAFGTTYGNEVTFTTLNITATDIIKDIGATAGETYAIRMNVAGSLGSVTVKLGTTGTSAVFTAGGGYQTMQGTYNGSDGLIITRSGTFNGTVDDVQWVRVEGEGTIDWSSSNYVTVLPISSEVFFKRIEDDIFNSYVFYRYLDLLFKDFDGYVTVTLKEEKSGTVTSKTKTFTVGNTSNPASPFSKKRISMLCKDQAIIIGLSNASLNETFAIAKFVLSGHKRTKKMFTADKIISVG